MLYYYYRIIVLVLTKLALESFIFGNLVDSYKRSVMDVAQNIWIDLRFLVVTPVELQDRFIIIIIIIKYYK